MIDFRANREYTGAMVPKEKRVNVKVDSRLWERLKLLAERDRRSRSEEVNYILQQALDDAGVLLEGMEDLERRLTALEDKHEGD